MKKIKWLEIELGKGIANAAWVLVIGAVIIFREDASLWLLAVPIFFNWNFRDQLQTKNKK